MKRNFWPYAIIAYFAVFITGVVVWIVFAVQNEDQLVRPDYYDHEIRYQQQIDRLARTSPLRSEVEVAYHPAAQAIQITLPPGHRSNRTEGLIHLYRPSDAKLDRKLPLALDSRGQQRIAADGLLPGYWKVRLAWTSAGQEYYFDAPLMLGGN